MPNGHTTPSEPHEDRWHYLESRDEKHEENYVEWKYFNFVQKDLSGYIIYYLLDPEKRTKMGGGRLLVRILKDGNSYGLIKKVEMDNIELDAVSASVRMDNAKIIEHDSYHYEITCGSEDASWNLNYKQKAPSVESFTDVHTGLMRWEKASWLIKMPRAEVKGTIRIGEDVFNIDGLGYSDTNWGEIMPFFSKYEWGQYNEENFSLVFGLLYDFHKIKSSYIYLIIGEHLVKMEHALCSMEHAEWEKDETIGIEVPSKNTFTAKEGEYEVNFTTTLLYHDAPGLKVHPLLPSVVVSEQIVEYEGAVLKGGEVIHRFKGRGFEEWSGKTWKEVAVPF